MYSRTRKKKLPKQQPNIPCQYNCGRPAAGTLLINYTVFDELVEQAYRHGFGVTIPCCRECLKGAVRVTLAIPDVDGSTPAIGHGG